MKLAVVGATGAVGAEILRILEERDLGIAELVPIATARSAGRRIMHRGREFEVVAISAEAFDGVDVALFDTPDETSVEWAPVAVSRGAVVVDNSAAWRMDPGVPLVVPEINPDAASARPKGIIASPNCTMLTLVVPLGALHRAAGVRRVILSSYQAASGAGQAGSDELVYQIGAAAGQPATVVSGRGRDVVSGGIVFMHPLAMNVIPQIGSVRASGYTGEEEKVGDETRKVLGLPDLRVTATCVRVPVIVGHSLAVHAEFDRAISADEARSILQAAAGIEVRDDAAAGIYPTPLEAAGRDPVFVGRIRQDPDDDHAIEFFSVADNLRKGAALNAVQIAELLRARVRV
ncbi:MAG: aspartate-semialdehyde dehydrogenase [Candidatus Limnocylindrales bacterium]